MSAIETIDLLIGLTVAFWIFFILTIYKP
jgi:hypothetical protein